MTPSRAARVLVPLTVLFSVSIHARAADVCMLASERAGLIKYAVQVDADQDGNKVVTADIDRDGSKDQLKWFDPGSGSIIPADNSTATLTLKSSATSYKLDQQRLYVVKLEARYYVVTGWLETEKGPWHKEIFAVTSKGFNKLCSFTGQGHGQ
jgi:hypothetical protein